MICLLTIHPQYITDQKGKKISVVIPIDEYERIVEELEDLEDVELYDESKADGEAPIPMEDAFKMIEASKKRK